MTQPPVVSNPGTISGRIPEIAEHPATPFHSDDEDSSSSCSRSSTSVHQEPVRVFTGLSREAVAAASVPNASGYESPTESSNQLQQYPFPLAAACDLQLQQTRSRRGDGGANTGTIMTLEPVGDGTHILTTTRSRRASNRHGSGVAAERRRASHASGVLRAGQVFGAEGAAALRRMASIETAVEDGSTSEMEDREKKGGWTGLRHDLIRRICSHKWTWFTMTMATGGLSNVIYTLPWDAQWVYNCGLTVYLFNLVMFCINCVMLCIRFYYHRKDIRHSFTDPVESLYIPCFLVSLSLIYIGMCQYGISHSGVWLVRTGEILYWIYLIVSVFFSATMYLILWSTQVFPIHTMTPGWVFPAYPLLMNMACAANLMKAADKHGFSLYSNPVVITIASLAAQATGCLLAFLVAAAFIYRLMTQKLPGDYQRPGIFISIGPYAFTAAGILSMEQNSHLIFPSYVLSFPATAYLTHLHFLVPALFLWSLAVWFFLVSVGSLFKYIRQRRKLPFQMAWWSFVFPNTALVVATQMLGVSLDNWSLRLVAAVLAGVLFVGWVIVFTAMVRSLLRQELLIARVRSARDGMVVLPV